MFLNKEHIHVRCCAHVVNLIASEGLKKMQTSTNDIHNDIR